VTIDTRTDEKASRMAEIIAPEGPHSFKLRTLGRGEVRLFGVVFERPGPGVVYDSMGLDGARAKLLRRFDPTHWHDQLTLRRPDLLVLHDGTNESQAWRMASRLYRADLTEIVGRLRAALPGVSCLLVGPIDRAERNSDTGRLVTRPVVKRIVKVQREVAWRQGCAFCNTSRPMGGEGSLAKWDRMSPKLASGDLTHPTRRGADRIGQMLYVALIDGYQRYLASLEPEPAPPIVPGDDNLIDLPTELFEPVDIDALVAEELAEASGPRPTAATPVATPPSAPAAIVAPTADPALAPSEDDAEDRVEYDPDEPAEGRPSGAIPLQIRDPQE